MDEEKIKYYEKISEKDFDSQQKIKDYTGQELNKIIFYLTTGTFVLSISFIGYLKTEIKVPELLICSWVFFIIAIVGHMTAHWISKKVADRKQTLINESRSNHFSPFYQDTTKSDALIKKLVKLADVVDIVVLVVLFSGLVCLLIFAGVNLLAQNSFYKYHSYR